MDRYFAEETREDTSANLRGHTWERDHQVHLRQRQSAHPRDAAQQQLSELSVRRRVAADVGIEQPW